MAQEIRLACCCYKETRINPRVMPPETGLEMATINGAKAALMGGRIGSIEGVRRPISCCSTPTARNGSR